MLTARNVSINLHKTTSLPNGQYFAWISMSVKGIVTKHNNKSEIIKSSQLVNYNESTLKNN